MRACMQCLRPRYISMYLEKPLPFSSQAASPPQLTNEQNRKRSFTFHPRTCGGFLLQVTDYAKNLCAHTPTPTDKRSFICKMNCKPHRWCWERGVEGRCRSVGGRFLYPHPSSHRNTRARFIISRSVWRALMFTSTVINIWQLSWAYRNLTNRDRNIKIFFLSDLKQKKRLWNWFLNKLCSF